MLVQNTFQYKQCLCILSFCFFLEPPLKTKFSIELPPPHNIKNFSSLTQSYLLKVAKLLVKFSCFKFLVIYNREKHFSLKTFLSLNISDFSFFSMYKLQLKKMHSLQTIETPEKAKNSLRF